MDSKRALEETDGDVEAARKILREKGIASAAKKASRDTNEGLVEAYIHSGGRVGAIVELNCETDFVARTDDMKDLAHNVAMQVAAMSPRYVNEDDIPDFIRDNEQTVQDVVNETIAKVGENVRVRRFSRFSLGE